MKQFKETFTEVGVWTEEGIIVINSTLTSLEEVFNSIGDTKGRKIKMGEIFLYEKKTYQVTDIQLSYSPEYNPPSYPTLLTLKVIVKEL